MTTGNVFPYTGPTLTWADLPPDIFVRLSDEFSRRATEAYDKVQQYELVEGQEDPIAAAYNDGKFDAFLAASLLLDGAPKPDGWNVWVSEDAPAFKSWRKAFTVYDAEPDEMIGAYDEDKYGDVFSGGYHFMQINGDEWSAGIKHAPNFEPQIIRRYRVLPADKTPLEDEAVQP